MRIIVLILLTATLMTGCSSGGRYQVTQHLGNGETKVWKLPSMPWVYQGVTAFDDPETGKRIVLTGNVSVEPL